MGMKWLSVVRLDSKHPLGPPQASHQIRTVCRCCPWTHHFGFWPFRSFPPPPVCDEASIQDFHFWSIRRYQTLNAWDLPGDQTGGVTLEFFSGWEGFRFSDAHMNFMVSPDLESEIPPQKYEISWEQSQFEGIPNLEEHRNHLSCKHVRSARWVALHLPFSSFLILSHPFSSFLILSHPFSSFLILSHPFSSFLQKHQICGETGSFHAHFCLSCLVKISGWRWSTVRTRGPGPDSPGTSISLLRNADVFFGQIEIHQTLGFNPGHFMYPGWKISTSQPEFSVTSWPQLLQQASNKRSPSVGSAISRGFLLKKGALKNTARIPLVSKNVAI